MLMSTNLSRGEREGLLQKQLSRDADSGHIQYSCLYCGRDDFRRMQSLKTHMNHRCRNRPHVGERLNGEVEEQEQELSSNHSSTVVERLIEAAGLLESGGRYIVGSKEVQTTSADSQHASLFTSTNIRAAPSNTPCIPDAKFGLTNEQYNDDHSKIISFRCQMCEHCFQYSGRQYMSRHIHTCCDKYPEKAYEFGLATGTCMSCLRGRPCERNGTSAASAPITTTTSAGT
jgi:hypothetical protein